MLKNKISYFNNLFLLITKTQAVHIVRGVSIPITSVSNASSRTQNTVRARGRRLT